MRLAGLGLAILLAAHPAGAQIESALLSKIPFNLSNPGGKSLAMGGAFTAIADDATAVLANPAGLGLLSSVEVGVSGKRFDEVIGLSTARATVTGTPLTAPWPSTRAVNSDIATTRSTVEFAGVVVPVSSRFVLAAGYAENLGFTGEAGPEGYSYIELRDNRQTSSGARRDFLYEYREVGGVSLTSRQAGVSAGLRLTDRLRVGAGLTFSRTDFSLDGSSGLPYRVVNRFFETPLKVTTLTTIVTIEDFGGTSPGLVLGLHADVVPGLLTAGASYRTTAATKGTLVLAGDVPAPLRTLTRRELSFRVPSDAALGLAVQPIAGLTVAVEAQWVAYSEVFAEELPLVSHDGFVGDFPVEGALTELRAPSDVVIPRLGVEYVAVADSLRLAFRVGYHREMAHGTRADLVVRDDEGTPYDITDPPFSDAVRTVFDGGRPDDRFSGGLGATLGNGLSVDVAFDLGRTSRRLSASVFFRF